LNILEQGGRCNFIASILSLSKEKASDIRRLCHGGGRDSRENAASKEALVSLSPAFGGIEDFTLSLDQGYPSTSPDSKSRDSLRVTGCFNTRSPLPT
jgi:hypothetical protein